MNPALQAATYNALEAAGRRNLPNRIIEAFYPETFNATGYPVQVRDDGELWRYVDVMHETRLEQTVDDVLNGLTSEELSLFERAVRFMIGFTQEHFGRPLRCESALLRAMNIYRYIRALTPRMVMELGPGSGYLGLLVLLDGVGYLACENTQAFYLLQNHLWSAAAKDRFLDLADDDRSLRDVLSNAPSGAVVHVPWWKTVDFELDKLPGSVDVVTANHCLTEMQPNAMKYYLRLASKLLRPSRGAFVFEGWGSQINHSRGEVAREFADTGYRLCHADPAVVAYAAVTENEIYGKLTVAVPIKRKIRNMFRRLSGFSPLPYEYFIDNFCGANKVSAAVVNVQVALPTTAVHKYREIQALLSSLYGSNVASEEERFLALVGQKYL